MIRVRVEYDAYNRKFKLLDREMGSMLDDGAVYQLSVPLSLDGFEDDADLVSIDDASISRA